jgi:type II secretory pathway pseudopilin PulG
MSCHPWIRNSRRRSEQGYILLMLMLFITLLAIAAAAVAPSIAFRVKRDREEELIHRGTQYSRAIRRYVKKTGRYPSRLEELENTNNIRFLRKRYKDPVTGKDFKLLHVGEVQMTSTAGISGAASLVGGANASGAPAGGAALAAAGAMMASAAGQSMMGGTMAPTQNLNSDASADTANDAKSDKPDSPDAAKPDAASPTGGIGSGQLSSTVFGGGPIVGVASISKAPTIREFNHKNRYNQWQFIYDPSMDRGGLITTPAQPPLQIAAPLQQQNSSSPNSPGTSSSFGGMQSSPPVQSTPTQQQ